MGSGEMSCTDECRLGIYDVHNHPGLVPKWLKAVGPKADQLELLETMTPEARRLRNAFDGARRLWRAFEGVGDRLPRVFQALRGRQHAQRHGL